LSAVPPRRAGSVAAPSSPLPPDSKSTNKTVKTVMLNPPVVGSVRNLLNLENAYACRMIYVGRMQ